MKFRIGDRFKWVGIAGRYHVWEFVGPEDNDFVIVETNASRPIGYLFHKSQSLNPDYYEYLGNYGKKNHFNTLYDILNGRDDQTNTPGH